MNSQRIDARDPAIKFRKWQDDLYDFGTEWKEQEAYFRLLTLQKIGIQDETE